MGLQNNIFWLDFECNYIKYFKVFLSLIVGFLCGRIKIETSIYHMIFTQIEFNPFM